MLRVKQTKNNDLPLSGQGRLFTDTENATTFHRKLMLCLRSSVSILKQSLRRVFIDARFRHQKQCGSSSQFSWGRSEAPAGILRRHSHLRFPEDEKSLTIKGTSGCFRPCWPDTCSMCPRPSWGKDGRLRRPCVEASGLGSHAAWVHSLLRPLTS